MAIQRNYRKPDGIILAYPCNFVLLFIFLGLNLSFNDFTPSILLALDDPILPFPFLKMCLGSYIGSDEGIAQNPYLSPLKASDEVLRQFPSTRIMVASNDPLRDGSF